VTEGIERLIDIVGVLEGSVSLIDSISVWVAVAVGKDWLTVSEEDRVGTLIVSDPVSLGKEGLLLADKDLVAEAVKLGSVSVAAVWLGKVSDNSSLPDSEGRVLLTE